MAGATARAYTGRGFPRWRDRGSVDEGRGPGAQYISLTLFKHNKCSTLLRSNRPLAETILMSLSGVSERYWVLCLSWLEDRADGDKAPTHLLCFPLSLRLCLSPAGQTKRLFGIRLLVVYLFQQFAYLLDSFFGLITRLTGSDDQSLNSQCHQGIRIGLAGGVVHVQHSGEAHSFTHRAITQHTLDRQCADIAWQSEVQQHRCDGIEGGQIAYKNGIQVAFLHWHGDYQSQVFNLQGQ